MREYDYKEVEMLQASCEKVTSFGTEVQVKPIPGVAEAGRIDPHELDIIKEHWVARGMNPAEEDLPEWDRGLSPIEKMRDMMGFPNHNICVDEIHTKYEEITNEEFGTTVGIWRYYPRKVMRKPDKPALMFIHGGGWVGGTPYTVENFCRFIAEQAEAVVFNIDYALAPEQKYPIGFKDCWCALKHIYDHAEEYKIDKNKIAVSGDSAGGNLTCALALKDRDMGTHMIALQVPIYPVVTFFTSGNPFTFDIHHYEMCDEQKEMIDGMISIGRPKSDNDGVMMGDMYVTCEEAAYLPYVSPMFAHDHTHLAKALCVGAEFDGLREQTEYYGKMLRDAGNDVRILRYKGVSHAFIDRLGFVPQAEDLGLEIAKEMKAL